jgi:hypothetical protein
MLGMLRSARGILLVSLLVSGCASKGVRHAEGIASSPSPATPPLAVESDCRAPLGLDVVPVGDGRSGSTVVLARVHGQLLAYVADEEAEVVHVLDVESRESVPPGGPRELGAVPMRGKPGRMVMMSGGRLAVTLTDRAEVAVFTPSPTSDVALDLRCELSTPDEPVDVATTPGQESLLVTSDWGHTLTAFDPETGARRFAIDLPRGPRALLVASDGRHAYVAHAAGRSMTTIDLATANAREVDLGGQSTEVNFFVMKPMAPMLDPDHGPRVGRPRGRSQPPMRPRHRQACQGFTLAELRSPDPRILEPMVEVSTGDTQVQSSGYGASASATPELPAVAVFEEANERVLPSSVRVREPTGEDRKPPCILPRASLVSKGSLYVACMGIDALVEYDASAISPAEHERRRWSVASGPTGIAVHGSRAVVWSEFDGVASFVSLAEGDAKGSPPVRIAVERRPRSEEGEQIALGRALFHASNDKRISSDGRACASCHPDGRDDGLVWSTPTGPRQTPMLAGRLPGTAPYGWDGAGEDVTNHLGHTLARLEGTGLAPSDRDALVRYATTLEGPRVEEDPSVAAIGRGREVFQSAGCASCHAPESGYTDGKRHDVKSGATADAFASFDTPSLHFAAGTAPYFHDGRYSTLRALLTDKDGPMSAARDVPPSDLDALETFVRSL